MSFEQIKAVFKGQDKFYMAGIALIFIGILLLWTQKTDQKNAHQNLTKSQSRRNKIALAILLALLGLSIICFRGFRVI